MAETIATDEEEGAARAQEGARRATDVVLAEAAVPETQDGAVSRLETAEQDLIALWLRKHQSPLTQRSYRATMLDFLTFLAGTPLHQVTLKDVLDYMDSLTEFADATQARIAASLKSFFTFAQATLPGSFPANVGAAVPVKRPREQRAQRILSEEDVVRMIATEPQVRNKLLLKLLYNAAPRISEVCGPPTPPGKAPDPERGLRWRDLQERPVSNGVVTGQVTFYGKGQKTRSVLLKPTLWNELVALRGGAPAGAPVFLSRKQDGPLQHSQVHAIVKAAALRIGIKVSERPVSPHWWRHAAASHALDRGAPLSLVKEILGHESIETTGVYTHARPNTGLGEYLPL